MKTHGLLLVVLVIVVVTTCTTVVEGYYFPPSFYGPYIFKARQHQQQAVDATRDELKRQGKQMEKRWQN